MRFRVIFEGVATNGQDALLDPDALDGLLDQVMDELMKLDAIDPDIGATLSKGLVTISVSIETPESLLEDPASYQAHVEGNGLIRSAIHAAGVATPGWEIENLRVVIESQRETVEPRKDLVEA